MGGNFDGWEIFKNLMGKILAGGLSVTRPFNSSEVTMASSFSVAAVITGYHVNKEIWNAELDEELMCEREVGSRWDTFAVAMRKGSVMVGHVPQAILPTCSIFIRRGGSIKCRVTGNRQYSSDLPQGGLELPCVLTFTIQDQAECRKTEKCTNDSIRSMEERS